MHCAPIGFTILHSSNPDSNSDADVGFDGTQFVSKFEKRFISDDGAVTFSITNGDAMEL